jgi:hypothetical protein
LRREAVASGDPALFALDDELSRLPKPRSRVPLATSHGIAIAFKLEVPGGQLLLLSTTTVFGTATDVTLSEVTLEVFFPADELTRQYFLNNWSSQARPFART